jgi:hypothetical protein
MALEVSVVTDGTAIGVRGVVVMDGVRKRRPPPEISAAMIILPQP